jgi:hypothetical protein
MKEKKVKKADDDGSEKVRPDNEKDFQGIKRAQKSKFKPATEVTNEWKAREDENPASP